MKKLLIAFCAVAVCVSSFALKIGTVDMVVLVKNHPAYETNKTLDEKEGVKDGNI